MAKHSAGGGTPGDGSTPSSHDDTKTSTLLINNQPVHFASAQSVLDHLNVDPSTGLTAQQVEEHRALYGSNALPVKDNNPWWLILWRNLFNPITAILLACFSITVIFKEWIDATCLMLIIVLNTSIGFVSEMKSKSALDALKNMSKAVVTVIRDRTLLSIPIDEVVVGDILGFMQGDVVGADARVIESTEANESLLTGESESVVKTVEALSREGLAPPQTKSKLLEHAHDHDDAAHPHRIPDVPLPQRKNMVFRETNITANTGKAVVTAVGYNTEVGKLSKGLQDAEEGGTDFEKRVNRLLFTIFAISLVLCVVIIGINNFKIDGPILLYASATSIALLPESCLLLATLISALSLRKLSLKNAIVRKLNVLSTLGTITQICSDKTGTLTEGKMCAQKVVPYLHPSVKNRNAVRESDVLAIGGSLYGISHAFYTVPNLSPEELMMKQQEEMQGGVSEGDADSSFTQFDETRRVPLDVVQQHCSHLAMVSALCNQTLLQYDEDKVEVNPYTNEQVKVVKGTGNMTEMALAVMTYKFDTPIDSYLNAGFYRTGIFPFDSKNKMMSVGVRRDLSGGNFEQMVLTKGAPEVILKRCANVEDANVAQILSQSNALASEGFRVLAFAKKVVISTLPEVAQQQSALAADRDAVDYLEPVHEAIYMEDVDGKRLQDHDRNLVENNLSFVGLVAIYDPPKHSSFVTVQKCRTAKINTIMLTGDNPQTAANISRRLGILTPDMKDEDYVITGPVFDDLTDEEIDALPVLPAVIARCSPYSKLKMVEALQRRGEKVAMLGDASNDVLSLKQADVGACMGSGTELAKNASDIVIQDDNISTFVNQAVAEGKHIQQSVKKFVLHLLTGNSSEVTVLLFGLLFKDMNDKVVFPLSPLEILSVNMITSSLVAIALSLENIDPDILNYGPESPDFLTKEVLMDTAVYGTSVSLLSFFSYIVTIFWFGNNALEGFPVSSNCNAHDGYATCSLIWRARSVCYCVMTCCLLWHGYVCRHTTKSIFQMNFVSNKMMLGSVVGGSLLLIPALYIPWAANNLFKTAPITWEWAIVATCVVIHLVLSEVYKLIKRTICAAQRNKVHNTATKQITTTGLSSSAAYAEAGVELNDLQKTDGVGYDEEQTNNNKKKQTQNNKSSDKYLQIQERDGDDDDEQGDACAVEEKAMMKNQKSEDAFTATSYTEDQQLKHLAKLQGSPAQLA